MFKLWGGFRQGKYEKRFVSAFNIHELEAAKFATKQETVAFFVLLYSP